ncbi:MAG TPA: murein L,D-transpeptidase catalytic domain family protein [Chitinophagaceae bacterium]|nr:murein L,D-transpeptidase catalytic domain family protein [Chitinophagaceae bacterium]
MNRLPITSLWISAFLLLLSCTAENRDNPGPFAEKTEKKETTVSSKKKSSKSTKKKTGTKTGISKSRSTVNRAEDLANYAHKNGYSSKYCFLVDMSLPSGRNRFFVYDIENRDIAYAALVAHGSCNENFLSRPRFANTPECGCSSLGKYKVGALYNGKYGKSYRLYGLEKSNSNAFKRGVVIHGYDCVPDNEIHPMVLCNSLGCPMVSYRFFNRLTRIISQSGKPILLWVYR